jgi:hypothetical protein
MSECSEKSGSPADDFTIVEKSIVHQKLGGGNVIEVNTRFFQPNGRFETGKKICLSISGHHPESWQPSWSIRTALLAIIGFMPTAGHGTIGALDYKPEGLSKMSGAPL